MSTQASIAFETSTLRGETEPRLGQQQLSNPTPRIRAATNPDRGDLAAEVDARGIAWDLAVNKLAVVLSALTAIALLAAGDALGEELLVPALLLAVTAGLYFAIHWQLLVRGIVYDRPALRWINATVEGGLATIVLILLLRVKGAAWAMSSPSVLLYPIFIGVSAVRMRWRVTLYVGALCVVGFAATYFIGIRPALSAETLTDMPTLGAWAAWHKVLWISVFTAVGVLSAARMEAVAISVSTEGLYRQVVEREFGRFVSRGVAEAILRGDAAFDSAERRRVTVLFCDLRDFTSMCEAQPPEQVVELLNAFYERACAVVQANGGTVNKIMGDGLLALFNAPEEHPDHVRAACKAAHELMYAADELRRRRGLYRQLEIGIGIDTGDVVVGGIGAASRAEYTAIGSVVNRAARLQGVSREAHRRIVLSERIVRQLGSRANVVALGSVKLKGIDAPQKVYAFRYS